MLIRVRGFVLPSIVLAAACCIAGRAIASPESIADIQANSATGNTVTLASAPGDPYQPNTGDPVVTSVLSIVGTVAGHSYTNWSFLVADGTGGMDIFGHMPASNPNYVPTVGDTLQMNGTYSPFDQIPEVATLTSLTKSGTAVVPGPLTTTLAYINADVAANSQPGPVTPNDLAGELITIANPTITGTGFTSGFSSSYAQGNLTGVISDPSGGSLTIFNWVTSYDTSVLNLGGKPATGLTSITGFVDGFGSAAPYQYEFVPISATFAAPEPGTFALLGTGLAAGTIGFIRRRKLASKLKNVV
jgi:hypothetical protein